MAEPGRIPQPSTRPLRPLVSRLLIPLALLITVALGAWLRWALAGAAALPLELAHLRHAHAHLGYYGVLLPLSWMAWLEAGAEVPSRKVLTWYAAAVTLAVVGFARAGYHIEGNVGSTVVGAIWLWSGWKLRGRLRDMRDPLGAVLPALVLALACIPAIVVTLRLAPAIAYDFVATFLTMLLVGVLIPSALAVGHTRVAPWPVLLAAGCLGALRLGAWEHPISSLGLLTYSGALLYTASSRDMPLLARSLWATVAIGFAALATGWLPHTRSIAIGAVHFLILGPVLGTLSPRWLPRNPPQWAWAVHHAFVAALAGTLVAHGLGGETQMLYGSSVAGTVVAGWWAVVLVANLRTQPADTA